jgi:hypothetical protein
MSDFVGKIKNEGSEEISVYFNIENDRVLSIGNKMNEINEQAYMNGYNWDVFLQFYLKKNNSDLLNGMETDPEAGTFVAFYESNDENEKKADRLVEIIASLIDNEEELYSIIRKEGSYIEWD